MRQPVAVELESVVKDVDRAPLAVKDVFVIAPVPNVFIPFEKEPLLVIEPTEFIAFVPRARGTLLVKSDAVSVTSGVVAVHGDTAALEAKFRLCVPV